MREAQRRGGGAREMKVGGDAPCKHYPYLLRGAQSVLQESLAVEFTLGPQTQVEALDGRGSLL